MSLLQRMLWTLASLAVMLACAPGLRADAVSDFYRGKTLRVLIGYGEGGEDAIEAGAELGAEAMADGHLIPEENVWYVADAIPNGSVAAIILLEHLWAIPLRDAIVDAGGIALADEWIHAKDLIAVGVAAAAAE